MHVGAYAPTDGWIHMNEHQLPKGFFEMFYGTPRQGPGSRASTLRALSLATGLPPNPNVLDVGCGTGGQSLVLAEALPTATITAVDNHAPFVDALRDAIRERGLQHRMRAETGDMGSLPYAPSTFDILWSEGSVYNIGFETGLRAWMPLLRDGGYVAVSDAVWLVDDIPEPCRELWKVYPGMTTVDACRRIARSCGYDVVGDFVQPASDWEAFYGPIAKKLAGLRAKYGDDSGSLAAFDEMQTEMNVCHRFGFAYSYAFFVLRALPVVASR